MANETNEAARAEQMKAEVRTYFAWARSSGKRASILAEHARQAETAAEQARAQFVAVAGAAGLDLRKGVVIDGHLATHDSHRGLVIEPIDVL